MISVENLKAAGSGRAMRFGLNDWDGVAASIRSHRSSLSLLRLSGVRRSINVIHSTGEWRWNKPADALAHGRAQRLRCRWYWPAVRPAMASDGALEREQLAAFVRQIELANQLANHLAEQAASTASPERARYRFDYARLRADLKRIRVGVQDYLVPQRAQPRDPVPLTDDYVRRGERQEPSP